MKKRNAAGCLLPVFLVCSLTVCSSGARRPQGQDPFEDFIRKTGPLTPEEERKAFHLPPGFEIQLVASEPEIGKPMNMAFDARGQLWITQSREYPFAAPVDKPARDKIMVLSDFNSEGHAGNVTTFAEGLNIPIGLYPYRNGVVGFSIPNIYYFADTNGDGHADTKDLVLGKFGFDRDVHGLTSAFRRGYDGWIYADHGYNNNTVLTARDGGNITMNSGNCYRFQIDGSRVEQYSWGQVNPFGLMFDALGDLWSADCHSSPVYQLLHGAYYPSFGKPNDGLGFAPNICDHLHGSTAIAGMVLYDAEQFPREFRGNTFVGNVMTCRINRDSLEEHGSTRIAREQPDFLSTTDPWFRPVDLQLGPDGALYVADFYNRIIGHYEVPLDHPGRDRERGRIWRIIYHGPASASIPPQEVKLPGSQAGLLKEFSSSNIARRMLALHAVVDNVGKPAIPALRKMLEKPKAVPSEKVLSLWALRRLGGLEAEQISSAARDRSEAVRIHAMRILADLPSLDAGASAAAVRGLNDTNPYVQRSAAEALGLHPAFSNVHPLLKLRLSVPSEDAQLLHVTKISLRNQFNVPENLSQLAGDSLSEGESKAVAEVLPAIKSAEAAKFLLQHLRAFSENQAKTAEYLGHIARYAPTSEMPAIAKFTRDKFATDLDFQLALFESAQQSTAQRGGEVPPALREWGADLAERLLQSIDGESLTWRNTPIPGAETANPWVVEPRRSADGDVKSMFVCSLKRGGERLTGILRSHAFKIPRHLSFYVAGHDDVPSKPMGNHNFVRLREQATDQILAQSRPPRNDVAQRMEWDLEKVADHQGYLEVVDGNTGDGFAWLAVGRFDPEIIPLPWVTPSQLEQRKVAAAELAASLHLASLAPRLSHMLADHQASAAARSASAGALAILTPRESVAPFAQILSDAAEPMTLREQVATRLGEINSEASRAACAAAMPSAPTTLQRSIALALAANSAGGETLFETIAAGKASARLLQERAIQDKLLASNPAHAAEKIKALTANLPAASAERQKLIDGRIADFRASATAPSVRKGADVFKQSCAICHSIKRTGAVIGPQLDGVGGRGLERLVEDILDPSRNVDRAFRTTVLVMNDGDVQTGLFRREEGQTLVLAESNGKEISIPKKDIRERRESETSLMPDNFADVIPPKDFANLLAYLLSTAPKKDPLK
jgi:putative heme-binding domain-containing protein